MYSSGQVAAIILPVVLVMMVVLVSSLAGMWLVLQRRKRCFLTLLAGSISPLVVSECKSEI